MTYLPESEGSPSQPTLFSDESSISSRKPTPSASKSSKNTGRKGNTTATSKSLLPTPNARDGDRGTGKSPRDNLDSLMIHGKTKNKQWSQGASPASPFPPLDEEEERRTTATSGQKCLRLYEMSRPNGSLRKMLEALLTGTKAWFSSKCALIWKAQATKSGRLLFLLSPKMRPTEGTGFGLLPTAQAMDAGKARPLRPKKDMPRDMTKPGSWRGDLKDHIGMLETPTQSDWKGRGPNSKQGGLDKRIAHPTGTKTGLKLQPAFVEWMMGFPEGWCDFPVELQSAKASGGKKP